MNFPVKWVYDISFITYTILYIKKFVNNISVINLDYVFRNVDFGDILTPEVKAKHPYTTYDLVANIVHDGEPGQGTYRVHILHRATGQWYELQDLHVTQILPQMITLTEAYIQVNKEKSTCFFAIYNI